MCVCVCAWEISQRPKDRTTSVADIYTLIINWIPSACDWLKNAVLLDSQFILTEIVLFVTTLIGFTFSMHRMRHAELDYSHGIPFMIWHIIELCVRSGANRAKRKPSTTRGTGNGANFENQLNDWLNSGIAESECMWLWLSSSLICKLACRSHTHTWVKTKHARFVWLDLIGLSQVQFRNPQRCVFVVVFWMFVSVSSCYLPGEYNLCISTYRFHRQLAQYPFSACEIPQWQSLIDITSPNSNTKHTKPNKPHATQPVWSPHVCDYTHITSESHDHTREVSNRNLHIVCSEVVPAWADNETGS